MRLQCAWCNSSTLAALLGRARLIVERRGQLPDPFTIWDIQRKGWATLADHEAVLAAVDVLIATSHCREVRSTASPAGGRPSVRYVWNPTLRQKE